MRVGLVRNVALGMVALVGLGLAGCDDNPTDFEPDETVKITTNPTVLTLPAGVTVLLSSRTENAGNEPTWEEIAASVDASCGSGTVTVATAATYEPALQPPGQFDVTGGTTMGESCIELSGGGASATVEVTVVGDSLDVTAAAEEIQYSEDADGPNATTQLTAVLLSADGDPVSPFDQTTDVAWSSDDEDVIVVDANGVATATGVGTATVTGTWTGFGVSQSNSVTLTVTPPATAVLTSLDVTSGPVGTYVTITGTGLVSVLDLFIDGTESSVFLDGDPAATTASFWMPNPGGGVGTYDVQIGVTDDLSNALTFDLTQADAPGEPDSYVTPKAIPSLPFTAVDWMDPGDAGDFYSLTLAADASIDVSANAPGGADIDVFVESADGLTEHCAAESADNPEVLEGCVLVAGTYTVRLLNFGNPVGTETPSSVRIDVMETPEEE